MSWSASKYRPDKLIEWLRKCQLLNSSTISIKIVMQICLKWRNIIHMLRRVRSASKRNFFNFQILYLLDDNTKPFSLYYMNSRLARNFNCAQLSYFLIWTYLKTFYHYRKRIVLCERSLVRSIQFYIS